MLCVHSVKAMILRESVVSSGTKYTLFHTMYKTCTFNVTYFFWYIYRRNQILNTSCMVLLQLYDNIKKSFLVFLLPKSCCLCCCKCSRLSRNDIERPFYIDAFYIKRETLTDENKYWTWGIWTENKLWKLFIPLKMIFKCRRKNTEECLNVISLYIKRANAQNNPRYCKI